MTASTIIGPGAGVVLVMGYSYLSSSAALAD
jgi:hypothetical protein